MRISFRSKVCLTSVVALLAFLASWPLRVEARPAPEALVPAPVFDASQLRAPQELNGPWLVHAGDGIGFADPKFDDSAWPRFDARTSITGVLRSAQPEVVWYRLHVVGLKGQGGLGLLEHQLSSAFEVYANGEKLMETGVVAPFVPYTFSARILRAVPASAIESGSMVIALRVHISHTEWDTGGPGLAAENLTLGDLSALTEHLWYRSVGENLPNWILDLAGLGVGVVALALFAAQRRQMEYLWIFLQFFATACIFPLAIYKLTHNVPVQWDMLGQSLILASFIFQILMFLAFLRRRLGWKLRVLAILAVLSLGVAMAAQISGIASVSAILFVQTPMLVLISVVLPVVLLVNWRRGNREAGILLIPIAFSSFSVYMAVLIYIVGRIPKLRDLAVTWSSLLFNFHAGPVVLSVNQLAALMYVLSLAIIMVLRSTQVSRQQALLDSELAAAREVQQVLLPERIESIPGFSVEAAYEPATQVGGDFFQILPSADGGLLVVIGDVAGKGLPAAMLVSVLVGAVRSIATFTSNPSQVLAHLNDGLSGRNNGSYCTALAAHIEPGGRMIIANAGHLPPYLNGEEVALPGALPLGVIPGSEYATTEVELRPGSRVTFYSDGVVEAQTAKGELFGFGRARDVSMQTATAIAEIAKRFGHVDDITVIAVARPV